MSAEDSYLVYTDGSCWTKDKIGSWAWIAIDSGGHEEIHGDWEPDTTISRMELRAVLEALETIYDMSGPSIILVNSDSQYVVMGANDRTRNRNKNNDLWDMLDFAIDSHHLVVLEHVKGHDGNHYNEIIDRLAGQLRKKGQNVFHKSQCA